MKICNVIYNYRHGRWSEIQKRTTFIRRIVILMAKSSPVNAIHPVAMYLLTSMLWIVPISIELRHEKRLCSQARNCTYVSKLARYKSFLSLSTEDVIFETLMSAVRILSSRWTTAIWMPLALIPRAHTTALAILPILEMVLYVKVSLLFSVFVTS